MPLTTRAAVPLLSWSRRTASCQETGPPREPADDRLDQPRQQRGDADQQQDDAAGDLHCVERCPVADPARSSGSSSARPPSGSSSRHHSRRRAGWPSRTTPSGSMTTPRSANRVTATAATGTRDARPAAASRATGSRSRGEDADVPDRRPNRRPAGRPAKNAARRRAARARAPAQRLAGRDPPGHRARPRRPAAARPAAGRAARRRSGRRWR